MNLVIQALTHKNEPLTQPPVSRFDERGGTIGRSSTNTLALPDPERHISRLQAEVWFNQGAFCIRNVGSANAILVNGRAVAPGESAPLREGDDLAIGAYTLRASGDIPAARPQAAVDTARAASPSDDALLMNLPAAGTRAEASPPPPEAALRDLFGIPAPASASPRRSAPPPARPVSPATGAAPPRLPPFPLEPVETTMPAMRVTRPRPADDGTTSSPMPMTPRVPPTPPAFARRAADAPAPPEPAPPAEVPPAAPATPDALWQAFREGAGLDAEALPGPDIDTVRRLGEVMRQSVDGMLRLVALRAAAKQELHAPVTTIQPRDNNPLKFSPDAATALAHLLQPASRGFLAGPQAVGEVMDDLAGHAVGVQAGMRAALEGVLARFEPQRLEAELGAGNVIDTLLPMNRRARLWELYLQHHQQVREEADEHFHALFGKAFLRAYGEEIERLDGGRPARA